VPAVNVITPVYNGAKYVAECIESVIGQTYADWRYDIIDNCSTDETRAIAEHYARLDPRIHVHAPAEFLPVVENHNRALTYLAPDSTFWKPMMADDRLLPGCLEAMVGAASLREEVGLVCCAWKTMNWTGTFDRFPTSGETVSYASGRDAARLSFFENRHFFGSPTTTLIRADLVRARVPNFYDVENFHADDEACHELLRDCDFAFVHEPLAFVREHEGSQTSGMDGMESIIAGRLYTLTRYGRDFMDEDEYRACLAGCERLYYDRLAVAALTLSRRRVWDYHRTMLQRSGLRLKRRRVAAAIIPLLVRRLRTPRSFLRALGRRLRVA
jgi:glycosyltransferase involved in cell wall biosynthesis